MVLFRDYSNSGQIRSFFINRGARSVEKPEEVPKAGASIVLFVHPKDDSEWCKWVAHARERNWLHVVWMSRSPSRRKIVPGEELDNVHRCEYFADRLSEFVRVKQFFGKLGCGEPDWDLLQHERWPEHLTAVYLIMFAAAQDESFDRTVMQKAMREAGMENLWDTAQAEANSRGWGGQIFPRSGTLMAHGSRRH